MDEEQTDKDGRRLAWIGAAGAALILAALGVLWTDGDHMPDPPPQVTEAPPQSAPDAPAGTEAPAEPVPPAAQAVAPEAPQNDGPGFDVVRLSQDGDTVIAGRAPPGAEVVVRDGDRILGTVTADERGEWVLLPDNRLEPGSRALTLEARLPDGTVREGSDQVVIVVPEPGRDIAGRPATSKAQEEPLALLVPSQPEAGGQAPVASRVLQRPSLPGSVEAASGDLTLDAVDYDDQGNLRLSGRGLSGAGIIAYLDNAAMGGATVDGSGFWTLVPDRVVDPGVYTLRLDQISQDKVISRLELPFSRAEPLTDFAGEAFVVVQPGNSLWRIARRVMGEGDRFTVIFDANKDQIRDPDLIYPGQIFEVPVGQ